MKNLFDLVGQTFGQLHVDVCVGIKKNRRYWRCTCVCGKVLDVSTNSLKTGNTKSCGCSKKLSNLPRIKDLIGRRFGRWLVVRRAERNSNSFFWECLCDCGQTKKVNGLNLVSGNTLSCGCLRKELLTTHGLSNNITEYRKYLWKQDLSKKLKHRVASMVRRSIKKNRAATFDFLPYSPRELKKHLENQFDKHMTWDNYGSYWHIDHIIPQAHFCFTQLTDKEFLECWSLNNLRPLEANANLKKGSKFI